MIYEPTYVQKMAYPLLLAERGKQKMMLRDRHVLPSLSCCGQMGSRIFNNLLQVINSNKTDIGASGKLELPIAHSHPYLSGLSIRFPF